jgi:uncharacterized protein (DUF1697 family)
VATYVALLRGVNVGGHRRVPMATLRTMFETAGHSDVVTYIASGNVVFDSPKRPTRALADELEIAILEEFGFEVDVVVRSAADMVSVVAQNPFRKAVAIPKERLYVAFPTRPIAGADLSIDRSFAPDEFGAGRFAIYLHRPAGFSQPTKLTDAFLSRVAGSPVTTRNWNTVTKLAELADRSS